MEWTPSGVMSGRNRKKEWMVCPRTVTAATPVGASTTIFLEVCPRKYCRSVDLPVPALPVTKTGDGLFSRRSYAPLNCSSKMKSETKSDSRFSAGMVCVRISNHTFVAAVNGDLRAGRFPENRSSHRRDQAGHILGSDFSF